MTKLYTAWDTDSESWVIKNEYGEIVFSCDNEGELEQVLAQMEAKS